MPDTSSSYKRALTRAALLEQWVFRFSSRGPMKYCDRMDGLVTDAEQSPAEYRKQARLVYLATNLFLVRAPLKHGPKMVFIAGVSLWRHHCAPQPLFLPPELGFYPYLGLEIQGQIDRGALLLRLGTMHLLRQGQQYILEQK